MMRACVGVSLLCLFTAQATGQEAIKLTARPAAAPTPALKYQLLPELKDMSPGNAALIYQRAHSPEWFGSLRKWLDEEKVYDWLELPRKDFPRDKVSHLRHVPLLREVDLAARRENCDWEFTERVRKEGYAMLIPDVQGFREYAVLLNLRARVEIFDKDYAKAAYTLQTGIALGRHVSDAPLLINYLVGNAIILTMLDRVEELMQADDGPNLYWALTALPPRLTEPRKALQGERLALEAAVPEIRTIETTHLTRAQQKKLGQMLKDFEVYALGAKPLPTLKRQFGVLVAGLKAYPRAKRELIAQGRKAEEVAAMPVIQVILIRSLQQYQHFQDELHKWMHVPYWQAHPGLERTTAEMQAARGEGGSPFLDLLPAVWKVYAASVSLERRIAALRCLEAVRLHAAAHKGKLPASLDAITIVPIPVDPATGKQFLYEVQGARVTLRAPLPAVLVPLHYEMTFVR